LAQLVLYTRRSLRESISRPLKITAESPQKKPWLWYPWGRKNVWFLFSDLHLSEEGNMLTCFLREAKVGILENKKGCVQYEKLVARHKLWGPWLRGMFD